MTGRNHRGLRVAGVLLLALCLAVGLAAGAAAAKKKKKKASVFAASVSPNAPIPDRPPGSALETPAVSTITVGKKFKGKTVGDVNVTGITTTGDSPNSASNLDLSLTAPSGKTVLLEDVQLGGQNIGPLTLDDDVTTSICDDTTLTCSDPDATLLRPFAGTANLIGLRNGDLGPLNIFDGVGMRGTWTFRAWDTSVGQTSTLNSWGVRITAEKPVK